LKNNIEFTSTGLSPSEVCLSRQLSLNSLAIYLHHISSHLSTTDSFCPSPLSLSANKGIIIYFLFLRLLRCFNSPRTSTFLCIRKSRDQCLHAAPPSLSQLATSFVIYQNQAIRLTAFVECFLKY
jgi:hypothetical protein